MPGRLPEIVRTIRMAACRSDGPPGFSRPLSAPGAAPLHLPCLRTPRTRARALGGAQPAPQSCTNRLSGRRRKYTNQYTAATRHAAADQIAQRHRQQVAPEEPHPGEIGELFGGLTGHLEHARVASQPQAEGIKYMFAIECSKPTATKAVIGGIIARILSVVVRALKLNQTARQTRALQKTPSMKA